MNRARCSGISMLAPTWRRGLTLAVFLFAGLVSAPKLILAQGSFQASGQFAPSFGQANSFTGATGAPLFNASAFSAAPAAAQRTRSFGMFQTPSTAPARDLSFKPLAWNRGLLEPSQPAIGFGSFGSLAAGSIGFYGIGRQQGGGFNGLTSGGMGSPQGNLPSLFPATGTLPRAQAFGTAQGIPPRFDARVAGSLTLPLNSSAGTFRMSYRDVFSGERNVTGTNFATGSGSATFGTSNLGNGMFLSAGTSYGSRSMAGSTVGNAPGGQKHSGPSVGLRLTF
jgi:hypothetical protein